MPDILTFFIGLYFDPRGVARKVFNQEPQPFVASCISVFLAATLVPVLAQVLRYRLDFENIKVAFSFLAFILVLVLVFIVLQGVLLMLFGLNASMKNLFSLTSYLLGQAAIGILFIYAIDYYNYSTLGLVTSFLTGYINPNNATITIVPFFLYYYFIVSFAFITTSIRVSFDTTRLTALLLGLLSFIPLFLAFFCGLTVADIVRPGTSDVLTAILSG